MASRTVTGAARSGVLVMMPWYDPVTSPPIVPDMFGNTVSHLVNVTSQPQSSLAETVAAPPQRLIKPTPAATARAKTTGIKRSFLKFNVVSSYYSSELESRMPDSDAAAAKV